MISSQEIIERSVFEAVMKVAVKMGYSLNPADYQTKSKANTAKFQKDKEKIIEDKGFYIELYGFGNNQSKGQRTPPAITMTSRGFISGDVGLQKEIIDRVEDRYIVSEVPYESIDQYLDIHLVVNKQNHLRLLQQILNTALPNRGYIKPYTEAFPPFEGNIFIELSNFYSLPELNVGVMDHVYQFLIKDTLLEIISTDKEYVPIIDISVDLNDRDKITLSK